MRIEDYRTSSGKNVITEYIYSLPQKDRAKALKIRSDLRERGLDALNELNTRQIYGRLYEIKLSNHRYMYVSVSDKLIGFVHAFKKESKKTDLKNIRTAKYRAKKMGLL